MKADDRPGAIFITGASRGLGAALALAFAKDGAAVVLCARGSEDLGRLGREIESEGGRCLATAVDVTDQAAVQRWIEAGVQRFGGVAVLINNASILGPRSPLEEVSVSEWRSTLEVNLTGTFLATRFVLPHMRRRGSGSIINVSSGAAIPPRTSWGPYAISKLALEGLSRNFAEELKGSGIRVNIVDPGAMRTEMRAEAYPEEDPETLKEAEAKLGVFLWLASPESQVSGERFHADRWRPG